MIVCPVILLVSFDVLVMPRERQVGTLDYDDLQYVGVLALRWDPIWQEILDFIKPTKAIRKIEIDPCKPGFTSLIARSNL